MDFLNTWVYSSYMSTQYTASLIYGIAIPRKEFVKKTKNTLFGKCKFNPDTGEKVEEFIVEEVCVSVLENACEILNLDTYTVYLEEKYYYFVGLELTRTEIGEIRLARSTTDDEVKQVKDALKLLEVSLKNHGVAQGNFHYNPSLWLVNYAH